MVSRKKKVQKKSAPASQVIFLPKQPDLYANRYNMYRFSGEHASIGTDDMQLLPKHKVVINIVSKELFQVSLITYLLLLLAETVKTGFVSLFFNLNWLLMVVLLSGIGMVLTTDERLESKAQSQRNPKYDFYFVFGLAIVGGVLVFYKTFDLGFISIILMEITALLIIIVSYLILRENDPVVDHYKLQSVDRPQVVVQAQLPTLRGTASRNLGIWAEAVFGLLRDFRFAGGESSRGLNVPTNQPTTYTPSQFQPPLRRLFRHRRKIGFFS